MRKTAMFLVLLLLFIFAVPATLAQRPNQPYRYPAPMIRHLARHRVVCRQGHWQWSLRFHRYVWVSGFCSVQDHRHNHYWYYGHINSHPPRPPISFHQLSL